jgi:anti-anti-sigma factor
VSKTFDDSVRTPDLFCWSRRRTGDAEVILLVGELDLAAAPELHRRLISAVESSAAARITLDLSGVTFLDAGCTGVIVAAAETAAARGQQLRVDGLHGTTRRVFEVLGLETMIARRVGTGDGGGDYGAR